MAETIVPAAHTMFTRCVEAGGFDGIGDSASPLTIFMMGQLLGIPVEQVDDIRGWTHLLAEHVMAVRTAKTPSARSQAASDDISKFFVELARTGAHSSDGVMAVLVHHHRSGELDDNQLVRFAILLFGAGHTTTNLLGNAIHTLTLRPGDLARMRADEAFIEPFIEEVLRTRPSFQRIVRVTTRDVEVADTLMPQGSIVRLLLASANRDPVTFPDGEPSIPTARRVCTPPSVRASTRASAAGWLGWRAARPYALSPAWRRRSRLTQTRRPRP